MIKYSQKNSLSQLWTYCSGDEKNLETTLSLNRDLRDAPKVIDRFCVTRIRFDRMDRYVKRCQFKCSTEETD